MREPKSTNECIYFTRRNDNSEKVKCWVFKEKCPECGKGLMQKPRDPKTGKPKIRSTEYVCSECGFAIEKKKHEDTLTANIQYECSCGHKGEIEIPFKRKNIQRVNEETGKKKSVPALQFECEGCGKKHYVTKKMK